MRAISENANTNIYSFASEMEGMCVCGFVEPALSVDDMMSGRVDNRHTTDAIHRGPRSPRRHRSLDFMSNSEHFKWLAIQQIHEVKGQNTKIIATSDKRLKLARHTQTYYGHPMRTVLHQHIVRVRWNRS